MYVKILNVMNISKIAEYINIGQVYFGGMNYEKKIYVKVYYITNNWMCYIKLFFNLYIYKHVI